MPCWFVCCRSFESYLLRWSVWINLKCTIFCIGWCNKIRRQSHCIQSDLFCVHCLVTSLVGGISDRFCDFTALFDKHRKIAFAQTNICCIRTDPTIIIITELVTVYRLVTRSIVVSLNLVFIEVLAVGRRNVGTIIRILELNDKTPGNWLFWYKLSISISRNFHGHCAL